MPAPIKTNENTDGTKAGDSVRHEESPLKVPESDIILVEGAAAMDYAKELAFMAELVEIRILESQDPNDTTRLVTISNNGVDYNMLRGQWTKVPRFILETVARLKRESWNFAYKKNADGSTSDTNQMHRMMRFPHQFRDTNPKEAAWYDSIKDAHY